MFRRLRDRTPTRAAASLLLAAVGLASHGLAAVIQWQGGLQLAAYATIDRVGAIHAWLAVSATTAGISGPANVFTGGSLLLAGWAIVDAGALSRTVGWVAIVAGVLNLINVFAPTSPVAFLGAIIFTIIWAGLGREPTPPPGACVGSYRGSSDPAPPSEDDLDYDGVQPAPWNPKKWLTSMSAGMSSPCVPFPVTGSTCVPWSVSHMIARS